MMSNYVPGAQVRIVTPGPRHGRIGLVTNVTSSGPNTRILVAGLDPSMPRLAYVFGPQELEQLPEIGLEVARAGVDEEAALPLEYLAGLVAQLEPDAALQEDPDEGIGEPEDPEVAP